MVDDEIEKALPEGYITAAGNKLTRYAAIA
jgi:hypothetical protein